MEKYKVMEKSECLECGQPIGYGSRQGQKFCCSSCRYTYNNRNRVNSIKCKKKIEHILQKNYSILCHIIRLHMDNFLVNEAVAMGFNASFMTSVIRYPTYMEYTCFDIAYRISDTKLFKIRRMSLNL